MFIFSQPTVAFLSIASVIAVSLLSLLGILFFLIEERIIRKTLLYFVSFSTGALLGDVFLHILPDLVEKNAGGPPFADMMMVILLGILFSFVVEKFIHWRHCHVLPEDDRAHHEHHHHSVGIMSAFGESVHNFIDGVVIGASYLVSVPLGIATTLAIVFHEIPHEIGNFAVLLHSGFSRTQALRINILSACTAILGTVGVLLAGSFFVSASSLLLPFAAGNLLYIAGSDLIPELHKETGARQGMLQLLAMIAGMGLMYAMLFLE